MVFTSCIFLDYLFRNPVTRELLSHNIAEQYIDYIFTNAIPRSISPSELIKATSNDKVLSSLKPRLLNKAHDIRVTAAFDNVLQELQITQDDFILRDHRIIIPAELQRRIIALAHDGHQGIVKTKELIRSKVWFPNIDLMVANVIQACNAWQINNPKTFFEPLHMSDRVG